MNPFVKNFSKKLLNLSHEKGRVSPEKVSAILTTLRSHPPRYYKKILKAYYIKIRTELLKENATLEHAGPLEESIINQIKTDLDKYYNRNISIRTLENPKLLAGLRISAADDVWDSSIAGHLALLAKSF